MGLTSWGNYPQVANKAFCFDNAEKLKDIIDAYDELIPYGNGRSYGDSALNKKIIRVKPYNYILNFEKKKSLLHVQAGIMLSEILDIFVPRGWFLKVIPGTKLITVGGAIASDVHGKNHQVEGCFSECVEYLHLMLPDGAIVKCSKEENSELFQATCGGMGLTGVILDAKIALKRINSNYIDQITIKTRNLNETFGAFETIKNEPYSVAWVDCLAKGDEIGKCVLKVGDFSEDGRLDYQARKEINVPFNFTSFALNTLSVKTFNRQYYRRVKARISKQKVDIDSFFFPLDSIGNWNRIYGKNGFLQYQFILPKATSLDGIKDLLKEISHSGKGSFLSVLKLYGNANNNYLSFPMEGYSLALDFKIERGLLEFLDKLDKIVLAHGGRIYLAKDARVSKSVFERGYPQIDKFRALREKYKMDVKFESLQSRRVGI